MLVGFFKTQPREDIDGAEYQKGAPRMRELAATMPGFVSIKRFQADDGEAFTLVTFESADALEAWRNQAEHVAMQKRGRDEFYER